VQLGKISGPNKHQVVLSVEVQAESIRPIRIDNATEMVFYNPRFDRRTNEAKIAAFRNSPHADYEVFVPLHITFREPGLEGSQVLGAFDTWLARVEGIVAVFEAETAKILAGGR
jgi:hypothetical protein